MQVLTVLLNLLPPSEAAARLKQLALDSSPLLATPRNNGVNINVALNNQVRNGLTRSCWDFWPAV